MMKKGQGISLNVVIIAAIALIVMVVLIMVFTGKIGTFTKETASCDSQGGSCVSDIDGCEGDFEKKMAKYICDEDGDGEPDDDLVCCLSVG